ncbi:MAG: ABC transporter ATP-binding protein [Dethiobacteria bacterium]|jgi:ATP-binding cassette subfamily B multidrug efflux pump
MKGDGPFQRFSSRQEENYRFSDINFEVLKFFWKYLKPHCPNLFASLVAALLVSACTAAGPYLIKEAIDRYIADGDLRGLTFVTLLYIGVNGISWLGSYWQSYLAGAAGEKIIYNIRRDLFVHLERLSLNFFIKSSPGKILSRLVNDVNTLSDLISTGLVGLIGDLLTITAIMGMMLYLNARLAFLTWTTVPLIYIFTRYFGKNLRLAFHEVRKKIAEINSEVQENITANKVVQALYRNEFNIERFEVMNRGNMEANLRAMGIFALFFPLIFFVGSIGTALVLWYGGRLAAGGVISVGLLAAFLQYVEKFHRPIREISQVYNVIQSAGASLDRIYEYMQIQPEMTVPEDDGNTGTLPVEFTGRIEICDVTFAYTRGNPVLKKINMCFEPGSTTALVGLSGAGKTTIVNLLARLYEVQRGQILIDGVNINQIPSAQLRKILAVVSQEPFLFSDTVMGNIRYGNPAVTEEMVICAARELGVHSLINRLPQGYRTIVGRRGERLSGGQKQIIALVRAFLSDPLILVLDEATSSLDSYTETTLKEALKLMLKNRTGIIIAHRFVLLELAERIYILQNGSIEASGQQEQVYRHSQLFKDLYDSQVFLEDAVYR